MTTINLTELFPARFRGAVTVMPESSPRTANYQLTFQDRGTVVGFNATFEVSVTVPSHSQVPFPLGTVINLYNANANNLVRVLPDPGVVIQSPGQFLQPLTEVSLRKRLNNEWVVAGVLV